jgi:deazaflavin-dependent oxidoreductase (nitroreductase family)
MAENEERQEWNRKIIEEFRANHGIVGGMFEGIPLLLLHHTGARSGTERVSPLAHRRDGDNLVVFASNGGRPNHPAWYHNLQAHDQVTVEVGDDTSTRRARIASGDERERLWAVQMEEVPGFADYAAATTRQIPVVVLEPSP